MSLFGELITSFNELKFICYLFPVLGEDFEIIDSYVEIPENFTSGIVELSVAIIPDLFVEGDHSFIVRIVDDGAFTVGTNSAVEVIILDDDSEFKYQSPTHITSLQCTN